MFGGIIVAIVIGAVLSIVVQFDERLRIADELPVAVLVGVSGAVAGWALLDTVTGISGRSVDVWDVAGAIVGATGLIVMAWRGRRRTFADLGLTPHSE
ncbi:MAG: hypothetical protein Q7T55_02165 [Solirubrobacteraceae bacterium]|nr:hypothetical protein [Solirubrobacteraceae bacterium]